MNPNIFKTKFAAACLATAIAGTGITISNAHGAPATAQVSSERADRVEQAAPAPAPAPVDTDADRYAERESTAKDQKEFQGGSQMLVIGISTTAAIVILVILLLIL